MSEDPCGGEPAALPPPPSPDAGDDERNAAIVARMHARFGAPSLEDYRRVYVQAGLAWPGDDEIRAMYTVAEDHHSAA